MHCGRWGPGNCACAATGLSVQLRDVNRCCRCGCVPQVAILPSQNQIRASCFGPLPCLEDLARKLHEPVPMSGRQGKTTARCRYHFGSLRTCPARSSEDPRIDQRRRVGAEPKVQAPPARSKRMPGAVRGISDWDVVMLLFPWMQACSVVPLFRCSVVPLFRCSVAATLIHCPSKPHAMVQCLTCCT